MHLVYKIGLYSCSCVYYPHEYILASEDMVLRDREFPQTSDFPYVYESNIDKGIYVVVERIWA
jgi:hypothetical protein